MRSNRVITLSDPKVVSTETIIAAWPSAQPRCPRSHQPSPASPFHPSQQSYADESSGHAPLQADPALVLGHSIPLRGPDTLYTTSDVVYHADDMLDRGAFGEASMYAPQFGLGSADTCINPGTLQVPPPVVLNPSEVTSIADGDTDQGASHELIEAHASSLRSAVSSLSSKEMLFTRKNTRRSSDSAASEPYIGRDNREHERKFIWTSSMAYEGPKVPQAQQERELEELERLEAGGAETKRERRRLRNRMAQRAYRARSKRQKNTEATYLTDLEELVGHQSRLLDHMGQTLAKLRADQLRTDRWQEAVPADVLAGAPAGSATPESPLQYHNQRKRKTSRS